MVHYLYPRMMARRLNPILIISLLPSQFHQLVLFPHPMRTLQLLIRLQTSPLRQKHNSPPYHMPNIYSNILNINRRIILMFYTTLCNLFYCFFTNVVFPSVTQQHIPKMLFIFFPFKLSKISLKDKFPVKINPIHTGQKLSDKNYITRKDE